MRGRARWWPENASLRSLATTFLILLVGARHFAPAGTGHKEIREIGQNLSDCIQGRRRDMSCDAPAIWQSHQFLWHDMGWWDIWYCHGAAVDPWTMSAMSQDQNALQLPNLRTCLGQFWNDPKSVDLSRWRRQAAIQRIQLIKMRNYTLSSECKMTGVEAGWGWGMTRGRIDVSCDIREHQ